jgi:hypothetical protein
MKTIDKLRKFAEGGKVRKYALGDALTDDEKEEVYNFISNGSLADKIQLTDLEEQAFAQFSEAKDERKVTRKLLNYARQNGNTEEVQ